MTIAEIARPGMQRQDIWCLTIRFWPKAAKAEMPPITTVGFEEGPQYYRPVSLRFRHPPTYGNFLEIYRRTPWMSVWRDTLLPVLDRTEWPVPAITKKRAPVALMEGELIVGELVVERECLWENTYVEQPAS